MIGLPRNKQLQTTMEKTMLNWIRKLFPSTVYIQIWENRIKINRIGSNNYFDEKPYIAIDSSDKSHSTVSAVGSKAYYLTPNADVEVINPFSHPRLLVSDFERAEKLLMYGIRSVFPDVFLPPKPLVVIHPRDKLEGGIAYVECIAYKELILGAGAREVHIHEGSELSLHDFDMSQVTPPKAIKQT